MNFNKLDLCQVVFALFVGLLIYATVFKSKGEGAKKMPQFDPATLNSAKTAAKKKAAAKKMPQFDLTTLGSAKKKAALTAYKKASALRAKAAAYRKCRQSAAECRQSADKKAASSLR